MVIAFKPTKVRKSFLSPKTLYVAGRDITNDKYVKGFITKSKRGFIQTLMYAKEEERAIVVSVVTTRNKVENYPDITWINPGNQEQQDYIANSKK